MLKLPPPIWTLIYILLGAVLSWSLGWPKIPGLPLRPLGIILVALAFILPVWAFVLFRREATEIDPTSPTNRKLITRGPYQFTRNPMYLGLVTLSLGIAVWIGTADVRRLWRRFRRPVSTYKNSVPDGQDSAADTGFCRSSDPRRRTRRPSSKIGTWRCPTAKKNGWTVISMKNELQANLRIRM